MSALIIKFLMEIFIVAVKVIFEKRENKKIAIDNFIKAVKTFDAQSSDIMKYRDLDRDI